MQLFSITRLCLIIKLTHNATKLLLPGNLTYDGYDGLSAKKLKSDIYKIGHHGQKNGVNERLLNKIQPSTVIICADSARKYDSACPEIISMLKEKT